MPGPLDGLKKATGISAGPLDKLGPVTQSVMPILPGGILNGLRSALGKGAEDALVPRVWSGPAQETLGEQHPDFTPVGGEELYNVGKKAFNTAVDPIEAAYHRYFGKVTGR